MKYRLISVLFLTLLLNGCASSGTASSDASPEAAQQAYTQLGVQYLQAGDTVNAKSSLQRALSINERYAPAHNALGLVFQAERDFELAERYFKRAIELEPMSAIFHNNYGAFLYARQRFAEACHQFSRATEDPFYPARAQAFENMGRCYIQLGRLDVAEHALRRSLDLQRDRPFAQVAMAGLLLDQGNIPEAVGLYNRFRAQVDARMAEQDANSLWVGVRIARADRNPSLAATYGLLLRNLYPDSEEYRLFKESEQ
ncbi:type IV pilus biogenesis/stability protein PilW [Nitrincola schmidtii]|uniref:type IV pilus biogenesis/stability protein PilW n=1 Tax=Nitrincola schmidtii TaxID=1730894 RepID=UPI00198208E0|nr:type IV pilus biogenesis/stability protein PilW [Nitrincola schmidtii]